MAAVRLNTTVLAATPMANVKVTSAATPGRRAINRRANRASCNTNP
jgi:hypothetical protein